MRGRVKLGVKRMSENKPSLSREEAMRRRLEAWAALTPAERGALRARRLRLWVQLATLCNREAGLPGDWDIPCRPDLGV